MDPVHWPLTWVSPHHLMAIIELVLIPLLHAITGMYAYVAARALWGEPFDSGISRASRFVLAGVLPLAVVHTSVRWLALPRLAAAAESGAWPIWAGWGAGIAALACVAFASQPACKVPSKWLATLGAAGGATAIASWAIITAFRLDPGDWLQVQSIQLAIQPPTALPILVVHAASIIALGVAQALVAETTQHRAWLPAVGTVSSAFACGVIVAAPWWLGPHVAPTFATFATEQGGRSAVAGWSIMALAAWATFAVSTHAGERVVHRWAPVVFAVIASSAAQGMWSSYRGPWEVRGWIHANGIFVDEVRTMRRSPRSGSSGINVFEAQCAPCHASTGPLAEGWRRELPCQRIRGRLEELREADRPGHPDRERMPPLLGSDEEIDALARWLHATSRCFE